MWLFGYELPDTLLLFTKTELHVVTAGKKGECANANRTTAKTVYFRSTRRLTRDPLRSPLASLPWTTASLLSAVADNLDAACGVKLVVHNKPKAGAYTRPLLSST